MKIYKSAIGKNKRPAMQNNKQFVYMPNGIVYVKMRSKISKRAFVMHYATFLIDPATQEGILVERESTCHSVDYGDAPTFISESELRAMLPEGCKKLNVVRTVVGGDGIAPDGVVIFPPEYVASCVKTLFECDWV